MTRTCKWNQATNKKNSFFHSAHLWRHHHRCKHWARNSFVYVPISCKRLQFLKPKWNFLTKWLTIAVFIEHKYVQLYIDLCVHFQRIYRRFHSMKFSNKQWTKCISRFLWILCWLIQSPRVPALMVYVNLFNYLLLTLRYVCVCVWRVYWLEIVVCQTDGGKSSKLICSINSKPTHKNTKTQKDKHAVKLLSFILVCSLDGWFGWLFFCYFLRRIFRNKQQRLFRFLFSFDFYIWFLFWYGIVNSNESELNGRRYSIFFHH